MIAQKSREWMRDFLARVGKSGQSTTSTGWLAGRRADAMARASLVDRMDATRDVSPHLRRGSGRRLRDRRRRHAPARVTATHHARCGLPVSDPIPIRQRRKRFRDRIRKVSDSSVRHHSLVLLDPEIRSKTCSGKARPPQVPGLVVLP